MKQKLLILSLFTALFASAQTPIFNSSMSISENGYVDSPSGEEVWNIIDGDQYTKFLDFEYYDGMEFTVDLGGNAMAASSIEITTANDFEERDPMNFEIFGSTDGTTFTSIASGTIACDYNRYYSRTFSFSNTAMFGYYRILLSNQCGFGNSIQISEVQLYQTVMGVSDSVFNSDSVLLYPNPSNGNFLVKQNGINNIDRILIVNAIGEIVKDVVPAITANEIAVNTENIVSGVYFVKIFSGEQNVIKKLILN